MGKKLLTTMAPYKLAVSLNICVSHFPMHKQEIQQAYQQANHLLFSAFSQPCSLPLKARMAQNQDKQAGLPHRQPRAS
jgi:hypothetical protein